MQLSIFRIDVVELILDFGRFVLMHMVIIGNDYTNTSEETVQRKSCVYLKIGPNYSEIFYDMDQGLQFAGDHFFADRMVACLCYLDLYTDCMVRTD